MKVITPETLKELLMDFEPSHPVSAALRELDARREAEAPHNAVAWKYRRLGHNFGSVSDIKPHEASIASGQIVDLVPLFPPADLSATSDWED